MSYQSAHNASQPKLAPCCQEFMAKHERGEHVLLLKDLLHFKNLTPEIDVENFLVSAHLYPMAERAVHAVYAHDRTVVAFRVFEDRFEALESEPSSDIASFQPALASEPMPAGLYAHLVEISKRPRLPLPDPKPTAEILEWRATLNAFRESLMDIAFGPGTFEGQKIWMHVHDYATVRKLKLGSDHLLSQETSERELLRTGFYGTLKNPEGRTRAIYVGRHVPVGSVIFDERSTDQISPNIPRRGHLKESPYFEGPSWLRVGAVIEALRIEYPPGSGYCSGAHIPPGRYYVADMTAGYRADTSEVLLLDMKTLTQRFYTTVEWLTRRDYDQDQARSVNLSYTNEVTKDLRAIPIGVEMPYMKHARKDPESWGGQGARHEDAPKTDFFKG